MILDALSSVTKECLILYSNLRVGYVLLVVRLSFLLQNYILYFFKEDIKYFKQNTTFLYESYSALWLIFTSMEAH